MNKAKRVFVYAEETPVRRDVLALGNHRAGPPIFRSIKDHIDGIAIYPIGPRFEFNDLDPELAPLCSILSRNPTLLCKALRKYPVFGRGIANALPAQLLARIVRRSSADILFSFIGADYGNLMRAASLAAHAGKSYAVFVVDDFISALRITGANEDVVKRVTERSRTVLRDAKHVFAITDGLGEHLRKNFGISSTTLNLAFESEVLPIQPVKKQIIYVGSINFLYTPGLRELFQVVERIRQASGEDLTVRLTVPAAAAARELGELPPFVVSFPVDTSEGLAREIASSLFAFQPSSFDLREKVMVGTSFPSKSMEYLAYARSIVVYGPDYGVATRLFREKGLPAVVSSPSELAEEAHSHLVSRPENSSIYRSYLAEAHSLAAARKTLCDNLGLEAC